MRRGQVRGQVETSLGDTPGDRSPGNTPQPGRGQVRGQVGTGRAGCGDSWGSTAGTAPVPSQNLGDDGGTAYEAALWYSADPCDLVGAAHQLLDSYRPDWHADAACATADVDMFATRRLGIEAALEVCGRCPVMVECRAAAIDQGERFGIWGGLDEAALRQAVTLDRKRRKGT